MRGARYWLGGLYGLYGLKGSLSKRSFGLYLLAFSILFSAIQPADTYALLGFGEQRKSPSLESEHISNINEQQFSEMAIQAGPDPEELSKNPSITANEKEYKPKQRQKEDVDKRTATTKTWLNTDGSHTMEYSVVPQHYKSGNKWLELNPTVASDSSFKNSQPLLDTSIFSNPFADNSLLKKASSGLFKISMKPFAEGLEVEYKDQKFTLIPHNGRNVAPKTRSVNGQTIVTYKNAWDGVDVEYELVGNMLKETIILTRPGTTNAFTYSAEGRTFTKHPTYSDALAISGIDPDELFISPLTVSVNERGVISEKVARHTTRNGNLSVVVDPVWLGKQTAKSFPIAIDPTIYNDVGGTYGNFTAYKSDGYACGNNICDPQAGTLYDNGWKHWRTLYRIPYEQMMGKRLISANLRLIKKQRNYWTGGNEQRYFNTWWAPCAGFNCYHGPSESPYGLVSTGEWINITPTISWLTANNLSGGWLMLNGENVPYTTYKQFEPTQMGIQFEYDTPPPIAQPVEPSDKQVTVTDQPVLSVNPVTDADNDAVKYYFRIGTGSDATSGAVINSGWQNGNTWTVPEGILQDGTTYYWRVYTQSGPYQTTTSSDWVRSFKYDARTGKDSTQSYDSVGPIGVDLATGNATTSTQSHSMSALGGNIGLNLSYDSPVNARKGLEAKYWHLGDAGTYNFENGTPKDMFGNEKAPDLKRVDTNIDFDWGSGSPGAGLPGPTFYAQWQGYFVPPTTGTYTVDGSYDDNLKVTIDGQRVYQGACCTSPATPTFSQGKYLEAGKPVKILVDFLQRGGPGKLQLSMKGVVSEQVVPSDWLRTEPRATVNQYGLVGRYYTMDPATKTFPSSQDDPNRLLMVRTDPQINFNWGAGAPAPGLQQVDDFMVRWTGYISVPESGDYTFGTAGDDGTRIYVGRDNKLAYDRWFDRSETYYNPTSVNIPANTPTPITIEYYERTGGASLNLLAKTPSNQIGIEIPHKWLTPSANALPAGWSLGVDVDGDVAYERIRVSGQDVILEDATRTPHTYTWTGSGYKPPVNEDGYLVRNANNTYTFTDTDGKVYVFKATGQIESVSSPTDDRNPAALQYDYSGDPTRLTSIKDGVNAARKGTVYYKNINDDGKCTVANTFTAAPDGMLCAFETTDSKLTSVQYNSQGQLAAIIKPGNDRIDYAYDELGRIKEIRDALGNDLMLDTGRSSAELAKINDQIKTVVSYDSLGRVDIIKAPPAQLDAWRVEHKNTYFPGGYGSLSAERITNSSGLVPATTPVSVSWGEGRIDQAARGTNNDLITRYYENGVWSAWSSRGGCITDSPAITSWGIGRLDVFVRGCSDTGNNLYHMAYDNSQWYGYDQPTSNGITIVGSPSVTSWGYQRLDFVARGTNGELYHGGWTPGSSWWGLGSLGGCVNNPTITSGGFEQLDIYVTDCSATGDNVQLKTWRPRTGWSPYTYAPGVRAASITASPIGKLPRLLVARATDGSFKFRDNTSNNWQTLAVCITDRPSVATLGQRSFLTYRTCGSNDIRQIDYSALGGYTTMNILGSNEPASFSKRVDYDHLWRTVAETDLTGKTNRTEWDPVKDLVLSTTDPLDMKSTVIYDADDRPVDSYGPAPSSWFGQDRKPIGSQINAIPRTSSQYDEGIQSLAVSYFDMNQRVSSVLSAGESLSRGQERFSTDGRYRFIYQTDGNVVLYGPSGALWSSGTTNVGSNTLIMQSDGNLVLYNGGTAVWSTGTQGAGYRLEVSSAGCALIGTLTYAAWASNTCSTAGSGVTTFKGKPLLNTTGIGTNLAQLSQTWSTTPIQSSGSNWGARMTGKAYLPTTGTWQFRVVSDGGVRLRVNDITGIEDWNDGSTRSHGSYSFTNTIANQPVRISIDYYHVGNTPAQFTLYMTPPGGAETANVTQYLKPGYSLKTTSKAYDAVSGDVETKTEYSNPAYGTVSKTILDPTGLAYETSATYEAPGAGLLRQTSKTLPGGSLTQYSHYSATEARDNPCETGDNPVLQGGRPKLKTEPDPDGTGTQAPRTSETIYNASGEVVATRYNDDSWTCSTYDERGRITSTAIPTRANKPGRTISNSYAVAGNPLVTSSTDISGTITVENDMLGRTVKYTDALGNVTTNVYDNFGKLTSRTSPVGIESYVYDVYDRLTQQKLDNITYATVTYDQYSRIQSVDYPSGMKLNSITRDALNRENGTTFTLGNGTQLTDTLNRYVSGDVKDGTENGVAKSYQYDKAGRLTGAILGNNIFSYEFGATDISCSALLGNNSSAARSGNRTKLTVNGASTTYCYDLADRLVGTSDPTLANVTYDSHGNTSSLGTGQYQTSFDYDTSDRSSKISAGSKETLFTRDIQGRIIGREHKVSGSTVSNVKYGFTGGGDSPDFLKDNNGTVIERYVTLPGDVILTLKANVQSAGAKTFSLPNIHGDIYATIDADGALQDTFMTGPFGEVLPNKPAILGSAIAPMDNPSNTTPGTSWNYLGQHQKHTDTETSLISGGIIQMGARIYIPALGRFLSVDPVEGGTDNNYAYTNDPVNSFDLDGTATFKPDWGQLVSREWWKQQIQGYAHGVYNLPVIGTKEAIVQPVSQIVSKDSNISDRAMGIFMLSPGGKVAKGGVYLAKTQAGKLYVGQTNNFARRAAEHARSGKIAKDSVRATIVLKSKSARDRVERFVYRVLGGKKAPWLENKIKPPKSRRGL